ncbi:CHCH domain-containing protein [Mycena kentingensis (nom. inval.)]|nr:CHCH domain-containing protein [Mycena kentingensis (nom. inval.)]
MLLASSLPRVARLPLRRCIQTQASSGPSNAYTKYALYATSIGALGVGAYALSSDSPRPPDVLPRDPTLPTDDFRAYLKRQSAQKDPLASPLLLLASSSSPPSPPEPEPEQSANTGAYNPETGEINWDCPCLGGMASGPCGEQFRAAFSCFIYSEDEPKGINCVDKFQDMQSCFREHPEVYAAEIADDEAAEAAMKAESQEDAPTPAPTADEPTPTADPVTPIPTPDVPSSIPATKAAAPKNSLGLVDGSPGAPFSPAASAHNAKGTEES